MKNIVLIGLIIIGVLGVGSAVMLANREDTTSTDNSSNSSSESVDSKPESADKSDQASSELPSQTVGQDADCSLYTLNDISGIWGVPMTDTDSGKVTETGGNYDGKLFSCGYNETDSGMGISVSIEYREYDSEEGAIQYIKDRRDGAKFGDTVWFVNDEVDNIGDEAFFSLSKGMADGTAKKVEEQLYARSGKMAYLLTAVNLDGVDATYRDKILATYRLHL